MILAVCPNLALDVTYRVDDYRPGRSVRVAEVSTRAGGKGANVARVAGQLASAAVLLGFVGGRTGDDVVADLDATGVRHDLVSVSGETRRTLAVTAPSSTTVFNEPGPTVTEAEWQTLIDRVTELSTGVGVVTVSGSLPPGSPDDAYARVVAASRAPVVVDSSGHQLLRALDEHPAVVKPNHDEASEVLGRPVTNLAQALAACLEFVDRGAGACIVTMGADGLVAVRGDSRVRVAVGESVAGNPTGAGDAFTACLATGLAAGDDWPEMLRRSSAVAAAAVARPLAGEFDPDTFDLVLPRITVEELS